MAVPDKLLNSFSALSCRHPKLYWCGGSILFLLLLLLLVFPLLHTLLLFFTPLILSTSLCIFAFFTVNPYLADADAELERQARLSNPSSHSHVLSERKAKSAEKNPAALSSLSSASAPFLASPSSVSSWFHSSSSSISAWFNPSSPVSSTSFHRPSSSVPTSFNPAFPAKPASASNPRAYKPISYPSSPFRPSVNTSGSSVSNASSSSSAMNIATSMENSTNSWCSWMNGLNDIGKAWLEKKLKEEGVALSDPADRETLLSLLQGSFAEFVVNPVPQAVSSTQALPSKLSQINEDEDERKEGKEERISTKKNVEASDGALICCSDVKANCADSADTAGGVKDGDTMKMEAEKGLGTLQHEGDGNDVTATAATERTGSTEKVLEASRRIIDAVKVLGASGKDEKHKEKSILSRFRQSKSRREGPAMASSDTKTALSPSLDPDEIAFTSSSSSSLSKPSLADLLVTSSESTALLLPSSLSSSSSSSSLLSESCLTSLSSSSSSSSSSCPTTVASSCESSIHPPVIPTNSASPVSSKLPRKFIEESRSKANHSSASHVPAIGFGPVPPVSEDQECSGNAARPVAESHVDLGPKFDDDCGGEGNGHEDDGLEVEEAQALVRSEFKMLEMEIEEVASKLPKLDQFLNTFQKSQPSSVRTPSKQSDSGSTVGSFASPTSSSLARSVRFPPLK